MEEKGQDTAHDLLQTLIMPFLAALQILTSKPYSIFSLLLLWTTAQHVHKSLVCSSLWAQTAEQTDQDSERQVKIQKTTRENTMMAPLIVPLCRLVCRLHLFVEFLLRSLYIHTIQNPYRAVGLFNTVIQITIRTDHPGVYIQSQTPSKVHTLKEDIPL